MKKVWIIDGCISCGTCEAACPEVFIVEDVAEVIEGADLDVNSEEIKEAADTCPVEVILYEE